MAVAVAWGQCAAAPSHRLGCPERPETRRIFGCDGPGTRGYWIRCWGCGGGAHGSTGCPVCTPADAARDAEGSYRAGFVHLDRCPTHHMTPGVAMMLSAYSHYREGVLPETGGWLDQAATWGDCMALIGRLVAAAEEAERA